MAGQPKEAAEAKSPGPIAGNGQFTISDTPSLEEVKKRYLMHVLQQAQGNVSATARILSIDRRSLYRMLARYKIEPFVKEG